MKYSLVMFCALLCSLTASAQEKISLNNVENYVGKEVTICAQVADLDSKTGHTYLYFGEHYPRQKLTIIVNRMNGTRSINISMSILLGRQIACYTGTIIRYEGKPDSSANFGIEPIKKEAEQNKPMMIGEKLLNAHVDFPVHTKPVDLRGQLAIIISDQKQISKKTERARVALY